MQANITAVEKFVPDKIISNAEFEKTLDTSNEWIISRTGIEERRKFYIGDWLRGKTAVNTIFKKIGYKNFVSIDSTLQGAPCNKLNLKNTGYDKCISKKIKLTELEINFLKATPVIDLLGKFVPTFFAYQFLHLNLK